MNKEEILRYIQVGRQKSVCISRCLVERYPGYVREIIISQNAILKVEFNRYGCDEGGLTIRVYYDDYDKLICSVQEYTGVSIEEWENLSKTDWYPDLKEKVDFKKSVLKLKQDLRNNTLSLPIGGIKYQIPEGYWKDIADGTIQAE